MIFFRKIELILFTLVAGFLSGEKETIFALNEMDLGSKGFKTNFGFI